MRILLILTVVILILASAPWSRAAQVRVEGEGYLRFVRDGRIVYAKSATLKSKDGWLVQETGLPVIPSIQVDPGFAVESDGRIVSNGREAGRLVLALFDSGSSLRQDGTVWISSERPRLAHPGEHSSGIVRSGASSPSPAVSVQAGPSGAPRGVRITLASETTLDTATVTLTQVARIEADPDTAEKLRAVDLGAAPRPGIPMTLDRDRITVKLRAAGFKPENFVLIVPDKPRVLRAAKEIAPAEFSRIAESYLRNKGVIGALDADESTRPYAYEGAEATLQPESHTVRGNEHQVQVAVVIDGKKTATRVVRLTGPAPIEGVRLGQAITLQFRTGGAVVELKGKARGKANVGETVEVLTDKDTRHVGTVIQPGVVEIKL